MWFIPWHNLESVGIFESCSTTWFPPAVSRNRHEQLMLRCCPRIRCGWREYFERRMGGCDPRKFARLIAMSVRGRKCPV